MTKKIQQTVNVSQVWIQLSTKIADRFMAQNPQLETNKRIRLNIAVCMYILYDILYKRHINDNLYLEHYGINYDSLHLWSGLSNNFKTFFRFLLDKHIIERWQSEKINPKTGRPYPYHFHCKGIVGTSSKYKFNNNILKAIENKPEVAIQLTVSQKNDYFFHVVSSYKKKLAWWKKNDVYGDYREPNEYELKVMERISKLEVDRSIIPVEGQMQPVYIHGRIYQNGWTNIKKNYRTAVKYNGVYIDELFDVPNCYVQFLAAKLEQSGQIEQKQLNKFCEWAYSGKFYYHVIEGTEYTKDDIKEPFMHFLFSSNWTKKTGIANQKYFDDGVTQMKYDLSYVAKWNLVVKVIKEQFPAIFKLITNYQQINVGGRWVSKLSVDLQWMQNKYVLNGLMKSIEKNRLVVEPIPLHDGIYITVNQLNKQIQDKVNELWNRILNVYIRKIKPIEQVVIKKQIKKIVPVNNDEKNWAKNIQIKL